MKRNVYSLILLFFVFTACEQVDELTKFNMDYDTSITIPSTTGLNLPLDIFTPDVKTNSESTFGVNDTRKDLVEEIRLKTLELTIQTPNDADFSFLKTIDIYIEAEGLPKEKIAWHEDVSSISGNMLALETTGIDLKEYIKQDEFSLITEVVTDEALSSDYTIDVHTIFGVNAKILGI
ncbi:hypothetical protein OKW21_003915 [Catalinimonas alkaloidigena]|uniref:hypothetical protein n=1 Tax=Catalinimonas alkaloidigena TaxID=1075417 RepID=UPI002406ADE6|nr:hypothetical protein [Catalinimonas alkaloidigena]MDF9798652.1 hypothetical protein [Catalinimonas alkaloidigena]